MTDLQSATTEVSVSISPSHTRSDSVTIIDDEDQQDELSEDNENQFDSEHSTMEDSSSNPSSNLQGNSRSFSWPESLSSANVPVKSHQLKFSPFSPALPLMSPPQTIVQIGASGLVPTTSLSCKPDKNQPLISNPKFERSTSESDPSPSSTARFFTSHLQQQTLNPAAGQVTLGTPLLYQVATAGQSLGGLRHQIVTPILTVLPSSSFNPGAATALQAGGQPLVFNPPLAPQTQSTQVSSQSPEEKAEKVSTQTRVLSMSLPDSVSAYTLPSPTELQVSPSALSPARTLASLMLSEMTPQYMELKVFAEEFKTKRIRLGYTQGAVGQSLARRGYNNFAQSTISRFEQMQLSPTNAAAIKLVLEKWLHDTEFPDTQSVSSSSSALPLMNGRKRKKRAVFTSQTRNSLEDYFKQNARPNRQHIEAMANELDLLPEEVRVWFCNKRQKSKHPQHNFQTALPTSFDRESSLSTSSCADSPSSLYESSKGRSPTPPKTPFTIEELSKSSSSVTTSCSRLTSPMNFSSLGMLRPLTTPNLFPVVFSSSQPTIGTAAPMVITNPPIVQTTA